MSGPGAGPLAGGGTLVRAIVRRDRVRIAIWIGALVLLIWTSAASVKGLYPTPEDLQAAATAIKGNAAAIALNGPDQGIATLGGRIAFETVTFGMVTLGLMSLFMVGRNARAEEESGRMELIRATVVGRHAPLAAAVLVVVAMNVVIGVSIALIVAVQGVPVAGSVVLGLGFLTVGLVFVAVAALTAQVSDNARVANGLAGLVVGLSFVLRAVGDAGGGALSWLSPIGWAQKARPFAGEQWWPLAIPVVFATACLALAVLLSSRRDLGGGLVPPRPGPPTAAPGLAGPLGLAWRLQRGALLWWSVGLAALGGVYGSIASDIEDFLGDNEELRDLLARSGADLVDSYFGTTLLVLAVIGSGFAVQSALRARSEEVAVRAEPLLAAPVHRISWLASHLGIALGGSVVVLAAGGLGLALSHAAVTGEIGRLPGLVGGALAYLPASAVLVGVATALNGWVPRLVALTWAVLVTGIVVGFLGELLGLPTWIARVSPFEHVPLLPAESVTVLPLALLSVVAGVLTGGGAYAFGRRDIG